MTTEQSIKWIKWNLSFVWLNKIQVEGFNNLIDELKLNIPKTSWDEYKKNTKWTTNIIYKIL